MTHLQPSHQRQMGLRREAASRVLTLRPAMMRVDAGFAAMKSVLIAGRSVRI